MLEGAISKKYNVDYLVVRISEKVDVVSVFEGDGHKIRDMHPSDYVHLVSDFVHCLNDPKLGYLCMHEKDEIYNYHGCGAEGLEPKYHIDNLKQSLMDRRVIMFDNGKGGVIGLPLHYGETGSGYDGEYTNITLRSDNVQELGYEGVRKLLGCLKGISTVERIDLACDYMLDHRFDMGEDRLYNSKESRG